MTTIIKIFCILASFTLFTLSTAGLKIEETPELAIELASEQVVCEIEVAKP